MARCCGPGDHHPAGPVPAYPVGLGQPAEGEAEDLVGAEARRVVVRALVEDDLLVDLVGHDDELVPPGDVDHPLDDVLAVDRAGRVVGVDDDDRVGVLGDLRLDVLEVGVPPVGLVTPVVHGGPAGQGHGAGPQGVVRRGDQHLVAVVDERGEHHGDQLGHAVADEDVVGDGRGQAAGLVVLRDGRAGGVDAAGVGVALRVGQALDHVHEDRLGGLEAERGGVPDVELEDLVALGLQTVGLLEDRTPHVVADVLQLLALDDVTHGVHLPITSLVATATWVGTSGPGSPRSIGAERGVPATDRREAANVVGRTSWGGLRRRRP